MVLRTCKRAKGGRRRQGDAYHPEKGGPEVCETRGILGREQHNQVGAPEGEGEIARKTYIDTVGKRTLGGVKGSSGPGLGVEGGLA